jgi:hypothetical protein
VTKNGIPPENSGRKQDARFKPGESGNPAGNSKGTRNRATLAMEALLDGEAEALTRKAVELALEGDTPAMRLCLERIAAPRKDRPVSFALPKLETAADAVLASAALLQAVAGGELTPMEAAELSKLVADYVEALKVSELEKRLAVLERRANG